MKKILFCILGVAILLSLATSAFAAPPMEVDDSIAFAPEQGLAAFVENGSIELLGNIEYWVWYQRQTVTVSVSSGHLVHTPWIMYYANDTELCKATTNHYNPGKGNYAYSRARYEGILGGVVYGSDSGRIYGTAYSEAETPDNPHGGWTGVAHTYCGD